MKQRGLGRVVLLAAVAVVALIALTAVVDAAAPAPAAAGAVAANGSKHAAAAKAKHAKGKGKGKGKHGKAKAAKGKAKAFDDFGLRRAAAFKLPKDAIKVRGNARTHTLRTGKLMVRSRLPMSDAKANKSAGLCKGAKCKNPQKLKAKAKAYTKRNGKGKGKGKGKKQSLKEKLKGLTAAKQFPKSAQPPIPFTAEEVKAAKARRKADGAVFLQLSDDLGADVEAEAEADAEADAEFDAENDAEMEADAEAESAEDAEAEAEAQEEAEAEMEAAEAEQQYGAAEIALEVDAESGALAEAEADVDAEDDSEMDADADAEAEAESEADAEAEADAELEVEASKAAQKKGGKKGGKRKHKKKSKGKKHRKSRVPVLVSRPSALVRRRVKAKRIKVLRGYARRIESKTAQVHVLTPHYRTITRPVRYTKTRKGKDGKVKRTRHTKLVTRISKRKRKIELTALLEVTGNVLFGKHETKKKSAKGKGKGKGKHKAKGKAAAAKHAATGTAFIEDMMVLSKRAAPAGSAAAPAAAHEYQHQWRLVYDDVADGWAPAAGAAAPLPQCGLHAKWAHHAAAGVPIVFPAHAYGGANGSVVSQTFGDLPAHSLVAVSGTFHFLGAWRGEVGFAAVNGQHTWLDTFAADTDAPADAVQQHSVPFRVVLPHTAHAVRVSFGATLSTHNAGACWAFDDVAISVLH